MTVDEIQKKHLIEILKMEYEKATQTLSVLFFSSNESLDIESDLKSALPFVKNIKLYHVNDDDLRGAISYFYRPEALSLEKPIPNDSEIDLKKENIEELLSFLTDLGFTVRLKKEDDLEEAKRLIEESKEQALKNIFWNDKPQETKKEVRVKNDYGRFEKVSIHEALENPDNVRVILTGELCNIEERTLRDGRVLMSATLLDDTRGIAVKNFLKPEEYEKVKDTLKKDHYYELKGMISLDRYSNDKFLRLSSFKEVSKPGQREERSSYRRSELNFHTNMSSLDGIDSFSDYLATAERWGMKAIAITDIASANAYPEAYQSKRSTDIKIIYGMEMETYDDTYTIVDNNVTEPFSGDFVAFDIETTGFNPETCEIIEIGGVRIKNFEVVGSFNELIKPKTRIPEHITELTGIRNEDVEHAKDAETVLKAFHEFIQDSTLVAHNVDFDYPFIQTEYRRLGIDIQNPKVDTLALSRLLLTKIKRHRLNQVAKFLKITQLEHHRALDDALVCGKIFIHLLHDLNARGIEDFASIQSIVDDDFYIRNSFKKNVTLLAKSELGVTELFENLSEASINHVDGGSVYLPMSFLKTHREHLLLGSGDFESELSDALTRGKSPEEVRAIAKNYDFLEILPVESYSKELKNHVFSGVEEIQEYLKSIVSLGKELNIPVCATTHARYINRDDYEFRNIIRSAQNRYFPTEDGGLYLRTTQEMLDSFAFLGEEDAYQVVIENPNLISDSIPEVKPFPDGKFPPFIEGSDEELRNKCIGRAIEQYGSPLPEIIEKRLNYELDSIINNGYSVLYITAEKLVKESERMGYLVGSRGSVGSSFAATMAGITEVNPLPAHYYCSCHYIEFPDITLGANGFDLPDKVCPQCGKDLMKAGFNIPFEIFMGFEGNKEPDIDLNFSPAVQSDIHRYTESIFGEGQVYKVGTTGKIAERTAMGYAIKHFEEKGMSFTNPDLLRIARKLTGVKRSTGQHPGGLVVVPRGHKITEFTPIQYPANEKETGIITTHFDYHGAIEGKLFKLDILGHDVPTIIHDLEKMTGVSSAHIRFDDKKIISIFNSTDALDIKDPSYKQSKGTLGIPEFGTSFVRQMLDDTNPQNLEDLIRISGLSHGTNVWLGNAQDLIVNDGLSIKDVIATRDQIMLYGIQMGLEPNVAFKTMEMVRKGKKLSPEQNDGLREKGIPEWFIESCKKISYLFPKAHAVAYTLMSFRIAFFKVYYPLAFYASHFSTKVQDFDCETMCFGIEKVRAAMAAIRNNPKASKKEQDTLSVYEVVEEFYSRGFTFESIDLYKSDAMKFTIQDGKILPPFRSIQGLGEAAALSTVEAREESSFNSIEDLQRRGKLNQKNIDTLRSMGALKGLSETDQLDIFSLL
ncbi:PolC-type DNA polymerase III [Guggenheimella bovis]